MSDAQDSLLPQTATPLARALDILEERLFGLPVAMITKDPWKVDAGLLDHLAWEYSVDVWDQDWPEDVKRNVIALAAEVHRHKGTLFALRRVLEALDVRTGILEWWQDAPGTPAGTFKVTAYAGRALYSGEEVFISEKMVHAIRSVIERAVPVSRGFALVVGARLRPQALRMACHCTAISSARFRMTITQEEPRLRIAPTLGGHITALAVTRSRIA